MSFTTNEGNLKNYLNLQLLLKQTSIVLRNIFCKRWELKHKQKWENVPDRRDELVNGFGRGVYKKSGKLQRKLFEKGDINEFDITTLCQLIQVFDISNLDKDKIKDIVDVRNKLAHHPTQEVDIGEFECLSRTLGNSLLYFGFPDEKLTAFYAGESIDGISLTSTKVISSDNISLANRLKEEGNAAFKRQEYALAIESYTEAIDLHDLPEELLSILYCNRSWTYLKLSAEDDIQKAGDDAKLAVNCRPSWWKTYYRLGLVYEAKKKYEKAITAYNKALSLDPTQLEVREARDGCRDVLAVRNRKEHLDPSRMPMSLDEQIIKIEELTGLRVPITSDEMEKKMRAERKSGDPLRIAAADVYLAHQYLTGMDNVRQSYEEAARLFAKAAAVGNAQAIYNLAILTKEGKGVKRDIPEAIRLLRQVAALPPIIADSTLNTGVAEAQHCLGLCYSDGVGVDPNPVEAVKWYEKSFGNGCTGAAHNLGWMYAQGKGVTGNINRAVEYWEIAATMGNVRAMETLEQHYVSCWDFDRAKHWWQCAVKNGSIIASQKTEFYTEMPELKPSSSDLNLLRPAKKYLEEMALLCHSSNKLSPSKGGFRSSPNFSEFAKRAREGSVTAKNLLLSFDHFMKGIDLFRVEFDTDNHKAIVEMIHEFAESYRIEHLVPRWTPQIIDKLRDYIEKKLKIFLTQPPSDFECDLRVCYVSLRFVSMDEMLEFCDVSIRRFPNEPYFYYIQQCILGTLDRHPEALRKANQSLKLFPDCISLRYNKAVHTRLSGKKPPPYIEAYESFMAIAPSDHRKIPECYYVIAAYYLKDDEKCRKYYDFGLKAEKEQLSCFLPYESTSKRILTNLFQFKSSMESSNFDSNSGLESSKYNPNDAENLSSNANATIEPTAKPSVNQRKNLNLFTKTWNPNIDQLRNSYRVELTVAHRTWASLSTIPPGYSRVRTSFKGHKHQQSPSSLAGLKPITFREMDITKDHVYEGFILQVSSIEDASIGTSVALVLADQNYDYQRGFVYNFSDMFSSDEITKNLGFGSTFSILNPYMRMAADQKPGIRIDDPRSIFINSTTEDQSKKCRFCLKAYNNLRKCARCKSVWYCSKECQNNDWKLLKHKFVCVAI